MLRRITLCGSLVFWAIVFLCSCQEEKLSPISITDQPDFFTVEKTDQLFRTVDEVFVDYSYSPFEEEELAAFTGQLKDHLLDNGLSSTDFFGEGFPIWSLSEPYQGESGDFLIVPIYQLGNVSPTSAYLLGRDALGNEQIAFFDFSEPNSSRDLQQLFFLKAMNSLSEEPATSYYALGEVALTFPRECMVITTTTLYYTNWWSSYHGWQTQNIHHEDYLGPTNVYTTVETHVNCWNGDGSPDSVETTDSQTTNTNPHSQPNHSNPGIPSLCIGRNDVEQEQGMFEGTGTSEVTLTGYSITYSNGVTVDIPIMCFSINAAGDGWAGPFANAIRNAFANAEGSISQDISNGALGNSQGQISAEFFIRMDAQIENSLPNTEASISPFEMCDLDQTPLPAEFTCIN
ncbi:MAG: hypothetical protein AAF433_01410 [Bacteroidota bacterium]